MYFIIFYSQCTPSLLLHHRFLCKVFKKSSLSHSICWSTVSVTSDVFSMYLSYLPWLFSMCTCRVHVTECLPNCQYTLCLFRSLEKILVRERVTNFFCGHVLSAVQKCAWFPETAVCFFCLVPQCPQVCVWDCKGERKLQLSQSVVRDTADVLDLFFPLCLV